MHTQTRFFSKSQTDNVDLRMFVRVRPAADAGLRRRVRTARARTPGSAASAAASSRAVSGVQRAVQRTSTVLTVVEGDTRRAKAATARGEPSVTVSWAAVESAWSWVAVCTAVQLGR